MKRLFKLACICFVVVSVLASCATSYGITYESRVIESGSEGPALSSDLASSYREKDGVVIEPLQDVTGYTFAGWAEEGKDSKTAQKTYKIENSKEAKTLVAYWNPVKYLISYSSESSGEDSLFPTIDALSLELPTSYTIETGAVINDISGKEEGYVFEGWIENETDTPQKTITVEKGTTGDRNFTSVWGIEDYPLTASARFVSGADYPESLVPPLPLLLTSYSIADAGAVLPELSMPGYIFVGWIEEGADESTALKTYTLDESVHGAKSIVALWDLEKYSLEYSARFVSGDDYDQSLVPELPVLLDEYTIADKGAYLPELSKPGYVFIGWIEEGAAEESAVKTYTLEEGVTGSKKIVALWDIEVYKLSAETRFVKGADYDPSLIPALPELPETYSVADIGKILPQMEKPGYIFKGWMEEGDDESTAVQSFTMVKGVTGDKKVVALWDLERYTLTYSARFISGEDTSFAVPVLPVLLDSYTIADVGAYLPELGKTGYVFKGWIEEGNDEESAVKTYTLEEGVLGDKSVVALWSVVRYPITYDEDGIIANDPVIVVEEEPQPEPAPEPVVHENRKSYTVEDEVTFINPTREGFTFIGWIEKEQSVETADDDYRIEIGTVGEKDLVAVWFRNAYTVSYDLNDGSFTDDTTVSLFMYDDEEGVELSHPVRDSYTFTGWKDRATGKVYTDLFTDTSTASDVVLEAEWTPVVYTIEYDLNGGEMEADSNPSTYTYETDTFTLITPVRSGYRFTGWAVEETVPSDPVIFSLTFSVENIDITVRMHATKSEWVLPQFFTDEYVDLVEEFLSSNFPEAETVRNGNIITLDYSNSDSALLERLVEKIVDEAGFVYTYEKTKTAEVGYDTITIEQGSSGDRKYKAEWELINYTLSYGSGEPYDVRFPLPEPEKPVNPTTYTVNDETFTLINPEKFGYDFMGWVLDDEEYTEAETVVTIEKGSTDDRVYTPLFRVHDYSVCLDLGGGEGEYPETFTIYDGFIALERPVRANYIFLGWKDADGNVFEDAVINTAEGKDCVLTALWKAVDYTVTYDLNGGEYLKGEENITTYNADMTCTLLSPVKYGYTFLGWIENEDDTPVVSLPLDTERGGDRSYKAVWKPTEYRITYNFGGGEAKATAKSSYTIEDRVELITPVRHGYTFEGWYDEKGNKVTAVDPTLAKDQEFTALWKTVEYSVKYDLRGGRYELGKGENITSYTVETPKRVLINPVRDTYTFAGWVKEDREDRDYALVDYVLDTTEGGDITLVATWKETEYKVTYDLDGGEFEYDDTNPSSFTNYDETFRVVSPTRDGYTFLGWVEEGKEGNRPVVGYTVDTRSLRSDITLKAVWTESSYSISYALNGGSYARGTEPNRTSYKRSDSPFVLTNPVRDGYTFLGWVRKAYSTTDVPSTVYTVDTSNGGALGFEALWQSAVYTVTYDLDGGSYRYGNTNPETYTSDDSFTLAKPYRDGYTFIGWIKSGDRSETVYDEVTVEKGTKGNLAFYAVYEENLVALGEVTQMQKRIVEKGKNDIPRPDWVISVPQDRSYHYEKAYASGGDFIENMNEAKDECLEAMASWLGTRITNVTKQVNSVKQITLTIDRSADIENAEMVEYWEDSNGGVWVLMRIDR